MITVKNRAHYLEKLDISHKGRVYCSVKAEQRIRV